MEKQTVLDSQDEGGDGDWLNFQDMSLLEGQSQIKTTHEDSQLSLLNNVADEMSLAGLGDLSCSLLHCDGHGLDLTVDENMTPEMQIEKLDAELKKRKQQVANLYKMLLKVVDKKRDGDEALNSVEKQLECLAEELKHSGFLNTTSSTIPVKQAPENVLREEKISNSTQTESSLFDKVKEVTKSYRNVSTSVSPEPEPNLDANESFVASKLCDVDEQIEIPARDVDLCGSPQQVTYVPLNPDSLRLIFSPSICEYETEANGDHYLATSVIEDLRLQVSDSERKLESTKKFLNEMTQEREQEREESQRVIQDMNLKYEFIRREKEKAENIIEHQQMELNELEDSIKEKDLVVKEFLSQLETKNLDLNEAVLKIEELREIIRTLEEQVDTHTQQAHALSLSDSRKDRGLRDIEDFVSQKDDDNEDLLSEMDHTEELQAQVDDLAKKFEEKLMELENFSWQNRPNSSCSVKSGDDISVRATTSQIPLFNNSADSAYARDFASRFFCGLRRLECSFDSLVRFEEVLLKKMKDADLKISLEHNKIDELRAENATLRRDLTNCHNKIKDFENFLQENKRMDRSIAHRSVETLRNIGTVRFMDGNSSPVYHQFFREGQLDKPEIDESEEGQMMEQSETTTTEQQDSSIQENSQPEEKAVEAPPPQKEDKIPSELPVPPSTKEDEVTVETTVDLPPPSEAKIPEQVNEADDDGYQTAVSRVASDEKTPAFLNDAPETEPEVMSVEVTTVSDYLVQGDDVEYLGTSIIPPQDPSAQEAQISRLEGMDAILELEKLKTELDQMRKALEAEKQKTQALENQLQEMSMHPIQQNEPNGDVGIEQEVSMLLQAIHQRKEKEFQLSRHLNCAVKTIMELREENQQARNYIRQLECEMQYYTSRVDGNADRL